jgi:cell division transport system ATP-binding protein
MIRFDNVWKRYPNGRDAVCDLTLEVGRGEMVFLTGHSGAGKSTLLKLVALIERPSRGTLVVNGQNTGLLKRSKIPAFRRQVGVVFQDHKLLMDRPVYDNVALPLVIAGVPEKEIGKRVRASLDQVGLLGRETSRPIELSTGEQRGIARAVISKPPILIADEPTETSTRSRDRGHEPVPAVQRGRRHGARGEPRPEPDRALWRSARSRRRPSRRRRGRARPSAPQASR